MNKQRMKWDIILLLGIILAALIIWVIRGMANQGRADMVVAYQGGKEIFRYPLLEEETLTIPFGEQGYNLLVISGGAAFISDADCPDRLCVSQRMISRRGESIICLPHKLVITIDSDQEGELDAVTY